MSNIFDVASAEQEQDLAQFEPDPDGQGGTPEAEMSAAAPDDPQWVVWSDAEGESDWANTELTQLSPRFR